MLASVGRSATPDVKTVTTDRMYGHPAGFVASHLLLGRIMRLWIAIPVGRPQRRRVLQCGGSSPRTLKVLIRIAGRHS